MNQRTFASKGLYYSEVNYFCMIHSFKSRFVSVVTWMIQMLKLLRLIGSRGYKLSLLMGSPFQKDILRR